MIKNIVTKKIIMFKKNKIKILFIIIFIALVSSCNIAKNTKKPFDISNHRLKFQSKSQFKSYTGFIVMDSISDLFYKIEEKYLQNYLDGNTNDTLIIRNVLKKTRSIHLLKGKSIEFFAWEHYLYRLEQENRLISMNIDNCFGSEKYFIIPVILVSCNYQLKNPCSEVIKCNPYLNKALISCPA